MVTQITTETRAMNRITALRHKEVKSDNEPSQGAGAADAACRCEGDVSIC
jgi:hypothetical protein